MVIATDLAMALDPVRLAEQAGIVPDPWQRDVLHSTSSRILMNVSRQAGKSTITSVLAVHTALYQPNSLVLLLSSAQRQSGELFKKCLHVYRALGRPVPATAESALRIELENGSRIVSLPGKEEAIRGYSGVRLLAIDEAARVSDDLYKSVRPMLGVSGGKLLALSTPFGKRGWWFEAWTGGEDWHRFEIPATLCPRLPPAFLAEEERTLGPFWFRQEYACQFSETTDHLFAYDDVMAAVSADVKPLFPTRR